MYRIVDKIASPLKKKDFYPALFLDVAQAFDRAWHKDLLYKIRWFPASLYLTLNFLLLRTFQVIFIYYFSYKSRCQGSILAPTLYNIYTADIPHSNITNLATFANAPAQVLLTRALMLLSTTFKVI